MFDVIDVLFRIVDMMDLSVGSFGRARRPPW
jgi:hypothetical protein